MCYATVASVVGTVAATGAQVYGASQAAQSKPGAPQIRNAGGFAPATALQSYSARLLAANRATKSPGILDWAASGGTDKPDWQIPEFTPKEATQLHFVERGTGLPIVTYDPSTGGQLSLAAQQQLGRQRIRNANMVGKFATGPQPSYARAVAREEMLRGKLAEGGLSPRREARLGRRLELTTGRRAGLEAMLTGKKVGR